MNVWPLVSIALASAHAIEQWVGVAQGHAQPHPQPCLKAQLATAHGLADVAGAHGAAAIHGFTAHGVRVLGGIHEPAAIHHRYLDAGQPCTPRECSAQPCA